MIGMHRVRGAGMALNNGVSTTGTMTSVLLSLCEIWNAKCLGSWSAKLSVNVVTLKMYGEWGLSSVQLNVKDEPYHLLRHRLNENSVS